LATAQAGVVTREQATALGMSRHAIQRLTTAGDWVPLARGIYLTAPIVPTWPALAWSGVLIGGDGARLGGEAAAYLNRLIPEPPSEIDVLVPAGRTVRVHGSWSFHRESPGARSAGTSGSPPRLGIAATVVDLCDHGSPSDTVHWLTTAVQKRLTTPEAILREMAGRARVTHRQLMLDLLTDVAAGAESALEVSYLRDVERAHGLPRGRRQGQRLGLPYHSDVGYDDFQTLVELDGRDGHVGSGRFRDMARDNTFATALWLTLRYGWFDVVDRPCQVAWQVATTLIQRAWRGFPTRCARCATVPEAELERVA